MQTKILCFLLTFLSYASFSQCPPGSVTFNNQAQVDGFLVAYPNCTQISGNVIIDNSASGPINNFNSLQNIQTITGNVIFDYSVNIPNLNGFNNVTHIGGSLIIEDTWITDITGLSSLQHVGGDLKLVGNHINNFAPLNNLTFVGNDLILSNDPDYIGVSNIDLQLTHIPGDFRFSIQSSTMDTMDGFSLLQSVGGDMTINSDTMLDLSGLESLQSVGGRLELSTCWNLQNIDGLSNLTSIGGLGISNCNDLTDLSVFSGVTSLNQGLSIISCDNIATLSGLENVTAVGGYLTLSDLPLLTSLAPIGEVDFSAVTNLNIYENYQLSLCQEFNVCNFIMGTGEFNIGNNAPGCENYEAVLEACNLRWKNLIQGNLRFDFDANGCTASDSPIQNTMVKAVSGGVTYSTFADSNGHYRLFVPEGTYLVSTDSPYIYFQAIASPSPFASFSGVGGEQVVDFCGTATVSIQDVQVSIYQVSPTMRPGFSSQFRVTYRNTGSQVANGDISVTFDDSKLNFTDATQPVTESSGVITANYNGLLPFQSRSFDLIFMAEQPPVLIGGEMLSMSAIINPVSDDAVPSNNVAALNIPVVNSYDPNDKAVVQGETILVTDNTKYLDYVVRFQNTGSASAINIRVADTLSVKLNTQTFELMTLSHPGRVQLTGNVAEFIFDDINLPHESENEPESHGFIVYRIKPQYNIAEGSVIENTAHIFFDFNPAIITNTVSTFVDSDPDSDGVYSSIDNCRIIANPDQIDADGDGLGDVCDDGLEVDAPYFTGFDTSSMDPMWRKLTQHTTQALVEVSNLYDADANGKTMRVFSSSYSYRAVLISPRLKDVNNESIITFYHSSPWSGTNPQFGFMTNPADVTTFTPLGTFNPQSDMALRTVNMLYYQPSMGQNFAILVRSHNVFIDDFTYSNPALAVGDAEKQSFQIWPNPATDILTVISDNAFTSLEVYDLHGRRLITLEEPGAEADIDVSGLASGVYLLSAETDGVRTTQRFLKE